MTLEELTSKLDQKLTNQCPLDLKDIKLYHQIKIQQKHNFYFSPIHSSPNHSYHEDDKSIEVENENNPNLANSNMDVSPNLKNSSYHNFRIISPFNKAHTCNCKKSRCIKNYCACRNNNEMCDEKCQCQDCKNYSFLRK